MGIPRLPLRQRHAPRAPALRAGRQGRAPASHAQRQPLEQPPHLPRLPDHLGSNSAWPACTPRVIGLHATSRLMWSGRRAVGIVGSVLILGSCIAAPPATPTRKVAAGAPEPVASPPSSGKAKSRRRVRVEDCSLLRVAERRWADGANPRRRSLPCVVIYRWAVKVRIPPKQNARLFYEPGGPLRFCGEGGIRTLGRISPTSA